jgi:small basic protein (TIGR04137 family)
MEGRDAARAICFRLSQRRALPQFVVEVTMSLDKSLKKAGSLARARNVLSRAERLALLQEDELWKPAAGVYNLPKTKYRRLAPGQSGPKRPDVTS